jgi:nucleotide-binding universal stress UspA family protein
MAKKPKQASIKRIMVPTDFTDFSKRAMEYAKMIAKKLNADLLLVHVIEPFTYSVTDTIQVVDHYAALKAIAEPLMESLEKKALKEKLKVSTAVLRGTPYLEIIKKARQSGADMIVMGTHGRTGVTHLLMGSVAERVVRMAHCPVLTVRA